MKSYARRFAIALLAFAALFIFVSCGGSATDAEVMGQDSASSDAQVDDVALSRDGTAQGLVEIQVVSRERKVETYSGSVHDVVTEYEYDSDGYLESMSQWSEDSVDLIKREFEYDDNRNLLKVQGYIPDLHSGWQPYFYNQYSYDENERCTSLSLGYVRYEYEYDDADRITSYLETNEDEPCINDAPFSFNAFLKYLPDGKLSSVKSTRDISMPSSSELSYEEEFSDPDSGVYTYRYHGRVTTLTFDEQGYLMRWVETAGPEYSDMTVTYEYKTITVDSATYKPSVYAIPTGYEEQWKPQYTEEERLRILGGQ